MALLHLQVVPPMPGKPRPVAMGCKDMGPLAIIYALIDPRTRLIRYVGRSSGGLRRPKSHHSNARTGKTYCAAWIRELRRLGLRYEIVVLEVCSFKEELPERERWWVAYGRLSAWPLTNLTDGGEGTVGYKPSEAAREALRQCGRAQFATEEARRRHGEITKAAMGQLPEATRDRMRKSAQRAKEPERIRQNREAHLGRVMSEESRQKMSAGQKAAWTEDRKAKVVMTPARVAANTARRGRSPSEEMLLKRGTAIKAAWDADPERKEALRERMRGHKKTEDVRRRPASSPVEAPRSARKDRGCVDQVASAQRPPREQCAA